MANGFTPKQQAFIDYYLGEAHGNATDAARRAGYGSPHPEGTRLLQNATVRAHIDAVLLARSLSSAEVLAELTDIARADWREFLQIRRDQDGEVVDAKLVLADKVKALELLGKYHKLFIDRLEHGADADFLVALRAAGGSP